MHGGAFFFFLNMLLTLGIRNISFILNAFHALFAINDVFICCYWLRHRVNVYSNIIKCFLSIDFQFQFFFFLPFFLSFILSSLIFSLSFSIEMITSCICMKKYPHRAFSLRLKLPSPMFSVPVFFFSLPLSLWSIFGGQTAKFHSQHCRWIRAFRFCYRSFLFLTFWRRFGDFSPAFIYHLACFVISVMTYCFLEKLLMISLLSCVSSLSSLFYSSLTHL